MPSHCFGWRWLVLLLPGLKQMADGAFPVPGFEGWEDFYTEIDLIERANIKKFVPTEDQELESISYADRGSQATKFQSAKPTWTAEQKKAYPSKEEIQKRIRDAGPRLEGSYCRRVPSVTAADLRLGERYTAYDHTKDQGWSLSPDHDKEVISLPLWEPEPKKHHPAVPPIPDFYGRSAYSTMDPDTMMWTTQGPNAAKRRLEEEKRERDERAKRRGEEK